MSAGPETTGLQDGCLILDWLSCTFPFDGGLDTVKFLFGDLEDRPIGMRGYACSAKIAGSGLVGWSPGRPEQGVHVSLPSSALSQLRDVRPGFGDVRGFIRAILAMGATIRRFDVAFDDRTGRISMDDVRRCVDEDAVVTRWRIVDEVHRLRGGQGQTLYFGSRTSQSFLRIYNKQAEQIDKGEPDPGHWVRVEVEFKDDKSHAVATGYLVQGVPFVVGIIRGLIDFKSRSADPNRSRWPTARWWADFLGDVEKMKLTLPREKPDLERSMTWLGKQVAPTLAFVTEAEGGSVDFLYGLLNDGKRRLSPHQRAMLQAMAGVAQEQPV